MNELSKNQRNYLARNIAYKRMMHLFRILLLFAFLCIWEISAKTNAIDSFIFSSPSKIVLCCYDMFLHENLIFHIGITLFETISSFIFVIVFTLIITILLWESKFASDVFEPYLVTLNSLPKSALAPLLIVWLGANYKTIILTGMSVSIFGSVLSLYTGFCSSDKEKIKLIRTLGGNKYHILTKVILPSNIPNLLSILKVNIGLCLVGVIIGEFIASKCGLGYLIIYSSQVFKLDWMIMSILLLCIIATCLYSVISLLEKVYCKRI